MKERERGLTQYRDLLAAGFDAVVYGWSAEPTYLSFSSISYVIGMLYGAIVPDAFKVALFGFGRKMSVQPFSGVATGNRIL